jgi:1-acyl-sn-glycerol-3-phosphate acyltransferase
MKSHFREPTYPRRRLLRAVLRQWIHAAFSLLADLRIEGQEHLPEGGPLILVGNHFSFIDPVAMIRATPWPLEFLAGFRMPNAPPIVRIFPRLWGVFPVRRGSVSRSALRSAESILAQGGTLGVFPEGGNWAQVLRPARPGAAYLAARTGSQILPMAFTGLVDLFPKLRAGKRSKVLIRIGEAFGPFSIQGRGRERRDQLDQIGHRMMERIARLLPDTLRGHYADDPAVREAARGTEIFPWDSDPER